MCALMTDVKRALATPRSPLFALFGDFITAFDVQKQNYAYIGRGKRLYECAQLSSCNSTKEPSTTE